MLPGWFVWLGVAVTVTTTLRFVWATVRGRTRPNRVTWFLWAVAPMIAFGAELDQSVGVQAALTFFAGFNPALIFLASFVNRSAYWRLTRFDFVCGACSVVAFAVWRLTASGNAGIALSVLADGLAAVPTLVKAYRHPRTESRGVFAGGGTNAAITLLTLDRWTFGGYAFPLYILLVNVALITTITLRNARVDDDAAPVGPPADGEVPVPLSPRPATQLPTDQLPADQRPAEQLPAEQLPAVQRPAEPGRPAP